MSATSTMTLPLSLQPIFTAPRAAATALISSRSSSNCSNTVPARFLGPAASIAASAASMSSSGEISSLAATVHSRAASFRFSGAPSQQMEDTRKKYLTYK